MMMEMSYIPKEKELFHIHTFRCGHAENVSDEEYVKAAVKLGASRIVFTDHAPFPGNPFGNRMSYEELPEYVETINNLKEKYHGAIEILCGLEIEYLPSFLDYYIKLKNTPGIDLLIVGQHFYEHEPGRYSFYDIDKTYEFEGQCTAMAQAISTGIFDVIAHPDRSFRASDTLGPRETKAAFKIIEALSECENKPCLEINIASKLAGRYFKEDFWNMVPADVTIVNGIDAHSVNEMINGWHILYD